MSVGNKQLCGRCDALALKEILQKNLHVENIKQESGCYVDGLQLSDKWLVSFELSWLGRVASQSPSFSNTQFSNILYLNSTFYKGIFLILFVWFFFFYYYSYMHVVASVCRQKLWRPRRQASVKIFIDTQGQIESYSGKRGETEWWQLIYL